MRAEKGASQIHRQHLLPQFERRATERRALGLTSVVDEDRDRATLHTCGFECHRDSIFVGNIRSNGADIGFQRRCHGIERFATTAEQSQRRALGREHARDRCANALAGAGDQRVMTLERLAHIAHAGSFAATTTCAAFSRAKIDSICDLPARYCFGHTIGV